SNKGINTICRFFGEETARDIVRDYGQADVVLAANCICHIQDLTSLAAGLQILLKPKGVLIFEDPYLPDIIEKLAYDQIYDEHAYYFSILSVTNWLARHGFEIVDVRPQDVHGGSMRYVVARAGMAEAASRVATGLQTELDRGFHRLETYRRFARNISDSRLQLVNTLHDLRDCGRRIVGYAATSKSTTVLNYCGISREFVEFISDTTPAKQGTFSPGMHI